MKKLDAEQLSMVKFVMRLCIGSGYDLGYTACKKGFDGKEKLNAMKISHVNELLESSGLMEGEPVENVLFV